MNKLKIEYNYDKNFSNNFNDYITNKTNGSDLSEKIKSLESEGLKLRSQVENILYENSDESECEHINGYDNLDKISDKNFPCNSFLSRDNTNISDQRFLPESTKNYYSKVNINSLYKELEESRKKLNYVCQQLQQEKNNHYLEKEELVLSLENLRQINFKLKSNDECELHELKMREKKLESDIQCMKENINQLVDFNKRQEDMLAESGKRLMELENISLSLKSFDNLRNILADMDYFQHSDFLKNYDLKYCSANSIVDIVHNCFKHFISDIDIRNEKVQNLEDNIEKLKRKLSNNKETSILGIKNQIGYLEEQNSFLKQHISEISENFEIEMNRAEKEILKLKTKMDNNMANSNSLINELKSSLQQLSNGHKKENDTWLLEKRSLEKICDENYKQIAILRAERDQAVNQKSSLLAKLDAAQTKLSETEIQLLQFQSEKYSKNQQVDKLTKRNKSIENSLSFARKYLENIIESLGISFKVDCLNSNNNETNSNIFLLDFECSNDEREPWKPRKYEFEEIMHQVNVIIKDKNDSIGKLEQTKNDIELMSKKLEISKAEKNKCEQIIKTQKLKIENSRYNNSHVNSIIEKRNNEIERLTAERDYYFQILNEKIEDLTNLKAEKDRLVIMLEASSKINKITNSNQKTLQKEFHSNEILLKNEIKLSEQKSNEELLNTYKDQTLCNEHLRNKKNKFQSNIKNFSLDYDENKLLCGKLKDIEYEMKYSFSESEHLKKCTIDRNESPKKKVFGFIADMSSYQNEFKITQDEHIIPEICDQKSNPSFPLMIMNDSCLENENIEKMPFSDNFVINEENKQLGDLLRIVTIQNDKMAEELETYVEENRGLRDKVCKKIDEGKELNKKCPSERYRWKNKNNSINELREDLQKSIKEAMKLLSVKTIKNLNGDYKVKNLTDKQQSKISKLVETI